MSDGKGNVTFKQTWDRPYLPAGGAEKVYLLIEARGNSPVRADRSPMNLSLVLDRSGSMSGAPLEYSKKACCFVADQLSESDRLSLVMFDDRVQTVVEPTRMAHKEGMKQRIAAIVPGGSTNLSGGLMEGALHVRNHVQAGAANRVILLSDGHANQGITDQRKLAAIAKEYAAAGVSVTAMGVGDGFDEELMEAISENGGGNFYYIRTPDQIPAIFQEELDGLLSVVAQNMKLTIQTTERSQVTRVFGYPKEGSTIHIGDLADQEVKSILIEMTLLPHKPGRHNVLTLHWEYIELTEGAASCKYAYDLQAEFTNDLERLSQQGNTKVMKHLEMMKTAFTIESALASLDEGQLEAGQQLLQEQAEHLLMMSDMLADPHLAVESEKLAEQLRNFTYSSKTRKELHAQKYEQLKRKRFLKD
jgi:Ca-activated chloride channel family protein